MITLLWSLEILKINLKLLILWDLSLVRLLRSL